MIPVAPAAEPPRFDQRVRKRGLAAIDELVGRRPRVPRRGPKRKAIAGRPEDLPAEAFPPFWRDVLPDMLEAYQRLCAYLALYIEHATGHATVDHMVAKSRAWDRVYEWDNYRLCAGLINARKHALATVLDPFAIEAGWFALELVGFQVKVGPAAPASKVQAIEATIDGAGLNLPECRRARQEYVESYQAGRIRIDYLTRRAPFVAAELRRQGRLAPADA